VTLYGKAAVWLPTGYALQGTVDVFEPNGTPTPYPGVKVIWEIGPRAYPTVSVRVVDVQSGELAWWSVMRPSPEVPVLTISPPTAPSGGSAGSTSATPYFWAENTALFFTHAGCYQVQVASDGGMVWVSDIAVGGRATP
jgi:hypothetical protein